MFNNPYIQRGFNQQNMYEQIDNQINQLQQMKDQMKNNQQQPAINQTFQLAPTNNHTMRYANTIEDVNKEIKDAVLDYAAIERQGINDRQNAAFLIEQSEYRFTNGIR